MPVRAMLGRVKRLERARTPTSPIVQCYGTLDAFCEELSAGIAAGVYDTRDMPLVIDSIERWHRDAVWAR